MRTNQNHAKSRTHLLSIENVVCSILLFCVDYVECDVDEFRYGVNHCVTSLLNKNERKQNEYKEHINRLLHVIVNVCCESQHSKINLFLL